MANTRESGNSRPSTTRSRSTKSASTSAGADPGRELLQFIPQKFRSVAWILLLLLSLVTFFGGVIFGGEYFAATDNVTWESYRPYLNDMADQGESPQWMPYIFSGMPGVAAYMVTGERSWDVSMWVLNTTGNVFSFLNSDVMRVLFYYFLLGIGIFALMRHKGVSHPVAFFAAFATIFSTWIIVWVMIGHNTKPMTLAFVPWVILFLDKLIDRWSLLYTGLLILAVHYVVESAHPQTAFYGAAMIAIWMLVEFIGTIRTKEADRTKGVIRAGVIGVLAAGFALGMGLDRILAVTEYNDYSTRGPSSIVDTAASANDAAQQYQYTTNWSFDVDETFTYVVPAYFGFGELELEIPGRPAEHLPTYWGNMPFTDAAHYMGIAVLLLGFFGIWRYRRNTFVVGLAVAGLFGLLISYGKNFPLIYDILYDFLPLFDKFRAPSQSLVILEMVFPILAGFGLHGLIEARKKGGSESSKLAKNFLYGGIASGVFLLIGFGASALLKSSYIQAVSSSQSLAGPYGGQVPPQIAEAIFGVMTTDWIFSGLFAVALCLLAWAYLQKKLKTGPLQLAVIALLVIDLWRIGYRPMTKNVPKEQAFAVFNTTDIDLFLQQDTTQYRIADVRQGQGFHPNYPAYHKHQHIGGYSAAKMRIYQDLMDVTANGSTSMPGPSAWNILNTKYIVASQANAAGMEQVYASQSGSGFVYRNPDAMPRAWFVDRVEVADGLDILTGIRDQTFNLWEVAMLLEPIEAAIDPISEPEQSIPGQSDQDDSTAAPQSTAKDYSEHAKRVQVTSWEPHHMTLSVDAPGTNFLVVSEMYYPPGWHATIDGQPAEIIQANYLLRGLVVPPGTHEIVFDYRDEGFETGKTISLLLNLLMLAIIGGGLFLHIRSKEDDIKTEESTDESSSA